jgi:diguanylate cyclase (GGDEF)-like protein
MQLLGSTHFTTRFLLPIVVATGVTIAALAGFLAWSAQRIDEDAFARDKQLLERALEELQTQLYLVQDEVATWDDAVDAVATRDQDWLVENMGIYAYEGYGHNRTLILSAANEPIMAMRDGGTIRPKAVGDVVSDLAPLLASLDTIDTEAQISAYNAGVSDEAPQAMDFTLYEGQPALVGIMPILSYSGENAPAIGSEARYVSVILLDAVTADHLGDQYRIADPHFQSDPPPAETAGQLAIRNQAGDPIAWLTWQGDHSGTRLLQTAMPALLTALAVGILIVGLLLHSLHRAMTQLQAQREEASHLAHHDPLTGLGNRSLFRARLSEGFRAMAAGEPRLAVLALDLDKFKQVNDSMGHPAGDELLTAVAGRLRSLMRPQDTLIRFGGDEFAVIMPGISGHDEPQALAQAIIDSLSRPVALAAGPASIGVSIGIATAPDLAHGETELMRFADDALYRAKNGGRNRYCLYRPDTVPEPNRRQAQLHDAFPARQAQG